MCLLLAVLGGLSLVMMSGLPSSCGVRASHCCGFSWCGTQALDTGVRICGTQTLERSLSGCGCPKACGIFLDQESSSCSLHW